MSQKENLNLIQEIVSNITFPWEEIPLKYKDMVDLSNDIYLLGALITQKSNEDDIKSELENSTDLAFLYMRCLNEYFTKNSMKLSQIKSLLCQ